MYMSGNHTREFIDLHKAEKNILGMIPDFNTCEWTAGR